MEIAIFASSRTSEEERQVSRVTFYKLFVSFCSTDSQPPRSATTSIPAALQRGDFCQLKRVILINSTAFVASCLVISLLAAGNPGRDFPGKAARAAAGMASGGKLV